MRNMFAVLFGMFLLPAAVARAEGPQPGQAGYVDPQPQQQMGDPNAQYQQQPQQAPAAEEQSSNQQAQEGRGIEYGAYLTVPIFVGSMGDTLGVGIGILGRAGWEFGSGFAAELNIGFQYNPDTYGTGGAVTDVWGGAGLRYAFLNASALVPFIGAGIQVNFWGADITGTGSTSNDSLALGFNALAGLAYEVSADFAIEAGLRWDISAKGSNGIPGKAQSYFSPFAGVTLYY